MHNQTEPGRSKILLWQLSELAVGNEGQDTNRKGNTFNGKQSYGKICAELRTSPESREDHRNGEHLRKIG